MTPEMIYAVLQQIVMGVVTFLVFLWGRTSKQTAEAIETRFKTQNDHFEQELELRDQQIAVLQRMMDRGNERSSEAANKIMVMVDNIRERLTRLEARGRHIARTD